MRNEILNALSNDQYDAWEECRIRVIPIRGRAPGSISVLLGDGVFGDLHIDHNGNYLVRTGIDADFMRNPRGFGQTFYIACLYVIWCIENIGSYIPIRENDEPVTTLISQIEYVSSKFLASTPFGVQIYNQELIRGVLKI